MLKPNKMKSSFKKKKEWNILSLKTEGEWSVWLGLNLWVDEGLRNESGQL